MPGTRKELTCSLWKLTEAETLKADRGRSASDTEHERGAGVLEELGEEPGESPKMGNQPGRAEEHDQGLYGA